MNKLLTRLTEYWRDKKLAEQCGLQAKDLCVHESDGLPYSNERIIDVKRCIKCGGFY